MSAVAILEQARSLGVSLRVDGDNIKAKGPRPAVEQILPDLQHKPELLAVLGQPRPDADEFGTDWLRIDAGEVFRLPFKTRKARADLVRRYPDCLVLGLPDATQARELTALVARVGARQGFTRDKPCVILKRLWSALERWRRSRTHE